MLRMTRHDGLRGSISRAESRSQADRQRCRTARPPGGGLAVNLKKLKEQPDQVRRMLKAMTQALRYMQENPESTQQVMMNWSKLEREMAAEIYQMAKNNDTKDGMVEETMLNSLVTTMLAETGIKNVAPSQLVDFTSLQQALK